MSFLQVILQAFFGALGDFVRAYQADQNLKALGYTTAQRDAATAQIKADDAATATRKAVAARTAGLSADGLRNDPAGQWRD